MRQGTVACLNALRFRLYPSRKQEKRLARMVETGRRLWNAALAHRKWRWESGRMSTSYSFQSRILTQERRLDPHLHELYSQAGQDILRRLEKAFAAFFRRHARCPRFKKYSSSGSFTYPQAYHGSVRPDLTRSRIYLSKVGSVLTVFHRPLPLDSRLKSCTIVREPTGKWFASLVYDIVVPLQGVKVPLSWSLRAKPIGIDLGLKSLITTSDGEKVEHPRHFRKAEKRLVHLQRLLSRKRKGSQNRKKARRKLAVQNSLVANQRGDSNHKLSTRLVRKHRLVAFEDLKVKNLVRNPHLAKSIHDAGWRQLLEFSEYKASREGSIVVRVPAAYSTQECWFCGTLNKHITLEVREFECAGCHRRLNRDKNAGRVVLKRALAKVSSCQVGQDKAVVPLPGEENPSRAVPELMPVEAKPLPSRITENVSKAVEAGTIGSEREGAGNHPSPEVEDVTPRRPRSRLSS